MLSGVGPRDELEKFKIPLVADLPVGQNEHDHNAITMDFRVRHPEHCVVAGAEGFEDNPNRQKGSGVDWLISFPTPDEDKIAAAKIDGDEVDLGIRSDVEVFCFPQCIGELIGPLKG